MYNENSSSFQDAASTSSYRFAAALRERRDLLSEQTGEVHNTIMNCSPELVRESDSNNLKKAGHSYPEAKQPSLALAETPKQLSPITTFQTTLNISVKIFLPNKPAVAKLVVITLLPLDDPETKRTVRLLRGGRKSGIDDPPSSPIEDPSSSSIPLKSEPSLYLQLREKIAHYESIKKRAKNLKRGGSWGWQSNCSVKASNLIREASSSTSDNPARKRRNLDTAVSKSCIEKPTTKDPAKGNAKGKGKERDKSKKLPHELALLPEHEWSWMKKEEFDEHQISQYAAFGERIDAGVKKYPHRTRKMHSNLGEAPACDAAGPRRSSACTPPSPTSPNHRGSGEVELQPSSPVSSVCPLPVTDDPLAEYYPQVLAEHEAQGWTCDQKRVQIKDCPIQDVIDKLEELKNLHDVKPGQDEKWRAFTYTLSIDPKLFVETVGSYRRGKADCGDIDILITRKPEGDATHTVPKQDNQGFFHVFFENCVKSGFLQRTFPFPNIWTIWGVIIYRGHVISRKQDQSKRQRMDFLAVPWESRGATLLYYTFNRAIQLKAIALGYSLN
ncbi:hypothetical protein BDQ17DRAFT_1332966 [Cyathus striatus]|nr:hypothetical protein BDQ17DRAFT_1332966 [Cyathus striatus]